MNTDTAPTDGPLHHDYIIIGAGSAGCVLAARLSENPDTTVLLLESGPEDTRAEITAPSAWPVLRGTEVDYAYNTVPQPGTSGLRHDWPRGHTIGGSSSINAMVFLRGHPNDFNSWNCAGWDYESVLPYFKRMESVQGGDPLYRGADGPMRPAPAAPDIANPLSEVFVRGAVAAGFPLTDDFNGSCAEGVGWHDLSITGGTRQSTARAYLHPVRERPNLTVFTQARARQLIFDGNRCVGVEFDHLGRTVAAYSYAEVILSAGAVDSPRLLLLSGVGPAAELESVGVNVVHNLAGVGRNLHDHPMCGIVYEAAQPLPVGQTNHAETSLTWRSDAAMPGPDMQIMFIHLPFNPPHLAAPANSFTFGVAVMVPEARGSIRLAGPHPQTEPLIDPNYLGVESDLRRMVEGIGVARDIAASEPFAPWRGREVLPGPDVTDPRALSSFLSTAAVTYFHPVGTCSMGTDAESVVDPQLRVHGLDGLRVVDASVMPRVVSVNTNAATIMIGEKGADLIRYGG